MRRLQAASRAALLVAATTFVAPATLRADHAPRTVLPDAVVDLRTIEGVARVKAQWRYSDTRINEIDHRSVGPDLKASGPRNRAYDFTPDARATEFDDSKWEFIPADSLEKRRGNGRLSLNWYRINITIPEKVGGFDTRGSTAVLEIVVDDYAEVWVNGKAPFVLGQSGGRAIFFPLRGGGVWGCQGGSAPRISLHHASCVGRSPTSLHHICSKSVHIRL